jgi:hypothetical protein
MPKPNQHQEKANHNRLFLDSISGTGPPDWMATVAFYTAVHLVEKLRAYKGEHSRDHDERGTAVRNEFRSIQTAYHELFNLSLVARYATAGKFTMTVADVKRIMIDGYLVEIEKFVAAETSRRTSVS